MSSTGSTGASTARDAVHDPGREDASLGTLLSELGREMAEHVRTQVELAKTEATQEAKQAAKTGGLFGAAGVLGYLALTLLCFAAGYGLDAVMPAGWAFLIVALVVGAAAAAAAVIGKKKAKEMSKPLNETIEQVQEDATWARHPTR